jgi:hypothetical protein
MTVSDFLKIKWGESEGPLIQPPRFSPVIADPSFLFPEESPRGRWELFAHSAWGVHRYSSPDGKAWRNRGIVVPNAMRPFIRLLPTKHAGHVFRYFLLYEVYTPLALPLSILPFKRKWRSLIAESRSSDLIFWSLPKTLIRPSLPWTREPRLGNAVSNPCLVETSDEWRLYYSASLVWLDDSGFCEPRYLAMARGASPSGPFLPESEPIVDPVEDEILGVVGAGSMKVLRLEDGYVGLQNKIYRDPRGRSRSALFVLRSEDGLEWRPARKEPLLSPSLGWMSSHVYACDCRFRESEGRWYLYFNARDGWRFHDGVERIGRMVGSP